MAMTTIEKITSALDALAVALTEYGHTWTARERELYEVALNILNTPQPKDRGRVVFSMEQGCYYMKSVVYKHRTANLTPGEVFVEIPFGLGEMLDKMGKRNLWLDPGMECDSCGDVFTTDHVVQISEDYLCLRCAEHSTVGPDITD